MMASPWQLWFKERAEGDPLSSVRFLISMPVVSEDDVEVRETAGEFVKYRPARTRATSAVTTTVAITELLVRAWWSFREGKVGI